LASPVSDLSEELAIGVRSVALDVRVAPECPSGPATSPPLVGEQGAEQHVGQPPLWRADGFEGALLVQDVHVTVVNAGTGAQLPTHRTTTGPTKN
jgi:hypothetical protein